MKTKLTYFGLVSSLFLTAGLMANQDDWSLNNRVTAYGDFLYMKRTTLDNKRIVKGHGHLSAKATVDDFDFESGYRVGLMLNFCSDTLEGSYSFLNEWVGKDSLSGKGNLYVPFQNISVNSDYFNASYASEIYTSDYLGAELNWWHHVVPRRVNNFALSGMIGLRFAKIDEFFELAMTRGKNKSKYQMTADNELYGGQLGGAFQWNPTQNFSWDLTAKVGAFYNSVKATTDLRDQDNKFVVAKYCNSGANSTFLGDVSLMVSYQLGCYFNIHAGYQLLYFAGLGLAPDQFTLNNRNGILIDRFSKNGEAIIHGAFAGINISF